MKKKDIKKEWRQKMLDRRFETKDLRHGHFNFGESLMSMPTV